MINGGKDISYRVILPRLKIPSLIAGAGFPFVFFFDVLSDFERTDGITQLFVFIIGIPASAMMAFLTMPILLILAFVPLFRWTKALWLENQFFSELAAIAVFAGVLAAVTSLIDGHSPFQVVGIFAIASASAFFAAPVIESAMDKKDSQVD